MRLRYACSPFEHNAKPVLVGQVQEAPSGSKLSLRYRAPTAAYVFYIFWYGFMTFAILAALGFLGGTNADLGRSDIASVTAIFVGLLVAPLIIHYIGTSNSERELACLLDFLAERVDAT